MSRERLLLMGWTAKPSWFLLVLLVLTLVSAGCGEPSARNLTLNEDLARESCIAFLTAWKDGQKAADLAPKIVGKDADWERGRLLESFEILPEERTDGANLFLKVRRTLKTVQGAILNQEVGYVVGTSPVITVFRSDH